MALSDKIKKGLRHPNIALLKVWQAASQLIPNDKLYLSVSFFLSHLHPICWNAPHTFNEKMMWLKLWSKNRGFERYVDKYLVREYVSSIIGERYLIPMLGVWDRIEDIDFSTLPKDYVLKTTHDSGGVAIVRGGNLTDESRRLLEKHLRFNYFYRGREYPYKNATPRIIAEQLMVDESGWDLKDYKFFCFNGEPKILFIAAERFKTKGGKAKFDYFNMELIRLPFSSSGHESAFRPGEKHPPIPGLDEMKQLARKLSKGFPFIRIDFYNINGRVYFGEMTFFHDDGIVPLTPREWDRRLGDMINLQQTI